MSPALRAAWVALLGAALGVRLWNALAGPLMWGYDAWGHVAYVLFLDLYGGLPYADQGWSYYHPPLHYVLGWGLARLGSGELLVRGLALVGSAASLGTAALAAWTARAAAPARPGLALVAFGAVAFLPAQLVVSPMPGNELTQCLLSASAVALFVANERRPRPRLALDALTGLLAGLALLAKANALLALASIALARAALCALEPRSRPSREAARLALIVGIALALAAPIALRNLRAFGTALPSNSDFALLQSVEGRQPPGSRTWRDYAVLPARLFADPDPRAPHLLHSVWGSLYLNAWADTHRENDVAETPASRRREARVRSLMALLGLLPSALAAAGLVLALRDVVRGRRRAVYVPLLALSGVGVAAMLRFSWGMPTWAALKVSYLLVLSLPFAVFLCRSLEALRPRARAGVCAALTAVAAAAIWSSAEGAALPRRADAPAMGAVHFTFGEYGAARRLYQRLAGGAPGAVPWLENLAAVELADGNPALAAALYARAAALAGAADAQRLSRRAVALALAGELDAARALLGSALEAGPVAELQANRGAIRAAAGDADAGSDLRAALEASPELTPAAYSLAQLPGAPPALLERAVAAACRPPRGHPYGVGSGEILEWGVGRRPLLWLDAGRVRLADPLFFRSACGRLRAALAGRTPEGL